MEKGRPKAAFSCIWRFEDMQAAVNKAYEYENIPAHNACQAGNPYVAYYRVDDESSIGIHI